MAPEVLIYQGLVGLGQSMYLWLIAAGLTIVFGVLGILNFAHGSFFMLGAYFAYTLYGIYELNFWLSIALSLIAAGLVGALVERLLLRHIYHLDHAFQLLLTFGLVFIFNDLVQTIWGGIFMLPPVPEIFLSSVSIFGIRYPGYNIFVIVMGLAVAGGLWLLFEKTWWGKTVRATASDREMAGAMGVNVKSLFSLVFAFGVMLSALGGALGTPVRVAAPGIGENMIIQAFIITVIGGLGNLKGAFVGALIVGVLGAYGTLLFPTFELFLIYVIMAVVLLVRPQGLFGRRAA